MIAVKSVCFNRVNVWLWCHAGVLASVAVAQTQSHRWTAVARCAAHESSSNRLIDWFIRVCTALGLTNRLTQRQTDHATCDIYSDRPHFQVPHFHVRTLYPAFSGISFFWSPIFRCCVFSPPRGGAVKVRALDSGTRDSVSRIRVWAVPLSRSNPGKLFVCI